MSFSEVEAIEKRDKEFVRDCAYVYTDESTGLTMYEVHVDELKNNHPKINNSQFGGFLSVRKKECEKPIVMIGQDECVFKQFLLAASYNHFNTIMEGGKTYISQYLI